MERDTLDDAADYQVAWIAALPLERAAAIAILDERHNPPLKFVLGKDDTNSYSFGKIGKHNVVIAALPAGLYGLTNAHKTSSGLVASFPHIKIRLLVGTGAAIPESGRDIRLGDVVVSQPENNNGGVVQYDFRKALQSGNLELIGTLALPPVALLTALGNLQAEHYLGESKLAALLEEAFHKQPRLASKFQHPGLEYDEEVVKSRGKRETTEPFVHYGTIASGNTLIKNAAIRQEIFASAPKSCICFEMEAAGLQNDSPCLVIRGICDYADENKNDLWQAYASATAAALAKELLIYLPEQGPDRTKKVGKKTKNIGKKAMSGNEVTKPLQEEAQPLPKSPAAKRLEDEKKVSALLQALHTCPYAERKDRNTDQIEGTCNWFTHHPRFTDWLNTDNKKLLWVSADPGCGKSVLARYLIDKFLPDPDTLVLYFFFKDESTDQRSSANAACALLRQALEHNSELALKNVLESFADFGDAKNIADLYARSGRGYVESFRAVWTSLLRILKEVDFTEVICVLDALDECQEADRDDVIKALHVFSAYGAPSKIKFLVTSRRYYDIERGFFATHTDTTVLHLDGDNEHEKQIITREIDIVIKHQVQVLVDQHGLGSDDRDLLIARLTASKQRTYLWVQLTLDIIAKTPGLTRGKMEEICSVIPSSVDDAYEKILSRSTDIITTKQLLRIVVGAYRPMTVMELCLLLASKQGTKQFKELRDSLEPEEKFSVTIRQRCGLFVTIEGTYVYLIHQTARAFLIRPDHETINISQKLSTAVVEVPADQAVYKWKHSVTQLQANNLLAEKCLWFLFLEVSTEEEKRIFDLVCEALGPAWGALEGYCLQNWHNHLRNAGHVANNRVIEMALELCEPRDCRAEIWPQYFGESNNKRIASILAMDHETEASSLLIAAYLGLYPVVDFLLKTYKISKTAIRHRALKSASFGGNKDIISLLLSYDTPADMNDGTLRRLSAGKLSLIGRKLTAKSVKSFPALHTMSWEDVENKSPLFLATVDRRADIMEILLGAGAAIDFMDEEGRTPLIIAAHEHDLAGLRVLLRYHNISRLESKLLPSLAQIYLDGVHYDKSCRGLEMLLDKDVAGSMSTRSLNRMLEKATRNSCRQCCIVLLRKGADANEQSKQLLGHNDSCTPIICQNFARASTNGSRSDG